MTAITTVSVAEHFDVGNGRRVILAPGMDRDGWLGRLADLDTFLADARCVHSSHSARIDRLECDGVQVAVKHFPSRSLIQRISDRRIGTPAERALNAAIFLKAHGVATPAPLAVIDGKDPSLSGGLLLTEWEGEHLSLRSLVIELLTRGGQAPEWVRLLSAVAGGIRAMHDAGLWHRDLGNQNILISRNNTGAFDPPIFIDLNRVRLCPVVTLRQRAFDLSRLYLPSDLRRILHECYFDARPPERFRRLERFYRRRFSVHTATRTVRHPLRTWRQRRQSGVSGDGYPEPRDLWIWDPRSVQAIAALDRVDRRRLMSKWDWGKILVASLGQIVPVRREAKRLRQAAFKTPVKMTGRIGLAISERVEMAAFEDACLNELGSRLHLLARFYAHESSAQWDVAAARLQRLHLAGHRITVVLTQDRCAVTDLERWRAFVHYVLGRVGQMVEAVQIGQAVNRTKWGVWTTRDYAGLVRVTSDVASAFPNVDLIGPAVIDFEPHYLAGFLRALPSSFAFGGVGHLLYVDRRGAPENRQGAYDTLGKLSVLRAIACGSPRSADRLVITETNWPLADTGVWSPICSPYLYSGQTVEGGVDEETYGAYMIRYLLMALCSGLADRVFWWRLSAHGFGLVDDKDSHSPRKRPAYDMFLHFVREIGTATFMECLNTRPGVHAYRFADTPSGDVVIAYAEADAEDRRIDVNIKRATDASGVELKAFDGNLPATGMPVYLYEPLAKL